ncbi:MFS transporter [Corallococcus sp. H22C18031201]|nr:MFS transporter [Citreicoccus inhibens]RJS24048.1 MFS transporter [Corallococcus sp. H22C18031201]
MKLHTAALRALSAEGLPRTYWVLWTGTLVNRLGSFVIPFLALYLTRERGFTPEQAGLVVSLNGLGFMLASPLGGTLADRLGRRITLAGGLWAGACAMLLLGFSRSPGQIAVAAFLLGLLGELYRPAVSATVADVVPPEDRPRAYGLIYWVVNVGYALAIPMAGLLAGQSYQRLFVLDAITTSLYGVIIWVMVPETRPRHVREQERHTHGSPLAAMLRPFRDPVYVAFCLPIFFTAMLFHQNQMALPLDLAAKGLTSAQYGTVLAVNGVLIVTLQPFVGRVQRGHRRSVLLAIASALTGLGYGMHVLSTNVPLAMMAVAVWTLGEMAQSPVAASVVADLAPPEIRGSYQGAYHMMWGLASCAAPALGGWTLGRYGSGTLWFMCLTLGLGAAGWHLAIAGARGRRLRGEHAEPSLRLD